MRPTTPTRRSSPQSPGIRYWPKWLSRTFFVAFIGFNLSTGLAPADSTKTAPNGAEIFLERCALCHGSKALGEGPMALLVEDYPNTNLRRSQTGTSGLQPAVDIVLNGGAANHSAPLSPPWRHELSPEEVEAVANFVVLIGSNYPRAIENLQSASVPQGSIDGRKIFQARCTQCHGTSGRGDGRMSRLINDPPPSDLSRSLLPLGETLAIITGGGAALNRSPQMPPWGQELVPSELISVAQYVTTLRAQPSPPGVVPTE